MCTARENKRTSERENGEGVCVLRGRMLSLYELQKRTGLSYIDNNACMHAACMRSRASFFLYSLFLHGYRSFLPLFIQT